MDAASTPSDPPPTSRRRIAWRYVSRETILIVSAYFAYFLVRGLTEGSPGQAFANAEDIIAFQRTIGIDWELAMQGWIADSHALVTLMNWVYIWGHWPVIAIVAGWLLLLHPREYRILRNAFLFSGAIGLVIFATYPVAPPRFMDMGLVDTVTENSRAYRVLQPPALVNQYAAVPSLHFGWNLLIGIVLVWFARVPLVRLFGLLMPPLMFFSIILTANHYVIDAVAGAAVALLGLALALGAQRLPPLPMPAFSLERVRRLLRA